MARNRRPDEDYIEETEQILENETTEEYEDYDYSYEESNDGEETSERPKTGKKILTVIVIIIALIALFFASSTITKMWLDYNEEPVNFESDVPDIDDDMDLDDYVEDNGNDGPIANLDGDEDEDVVPTAVPTESAKPSESAKPTESAKPSAKPSAETTKTPTPTAEPTKTPAPTSTPVPTAKPVTPIIPGNPAA